jgi:hypothetical protein
MDAFAEDKSFMSMFKWQNPKEPLLLLGDKVTAVIMPLQMT